MGLGRRSYGFAGGNIGLGLDFGAVVWGRFGVEMEEGTKHSIWRGFLVLYLK